MLPLAIELPHLPQRQIDTVVPLFWARQLCPPPCEQTPTSGLFILHVELLHFEHRHVPINHLFFLLLRSCVILNRKTSSISLL
jgi:hypothetical protein